MTTPTVHGVDRTGPAIRAVLVVEDPAAAAMFETQLRAVLTLAGESLDLSAVDEVMSRWHAMAVMLVNPLTQDERVQVARAWAGDVRGLRQRDSHGIWITQ